jgi:hypothetical protein
MTDVLHVADGNIGDFKRLALSLVSPNGFALNTVSQQPQFGYDAFGRIRTANPVIAFASNSSYDVEPLVWETKADGVSNTAIWSVTTRDTSLTLTSDGYVVRQTYLHLPYQPGRSQFITMTGVMGASVSGAIKRIGQFDAKNGLFFEQSNGLMYVGRRSSGTGSTVDHKVAQFDWNLDPLNGLGPSGVTYDPTKDNIYIIDYGWLGTATVRYGLYIDGAIIYCHASHHANILDRSYMQTATLPLRYEISGTPVSTATLRQICSAVSSEGGYIDTPAYQFAVARELTGAISTTTEAPIIAIRPRLTLYGIPNRVRIKIINTSAVALSNSIRWALRYYPPNTANPVTGGTFTAANAESAVEANVTGTALTTAGSYIIQHGFAITTGGGGQARAVDSANIIQTTVLALGMVSSGSPLVDNDGGNPAYMVLSALGASATAVGAMEWEEVR